jgi:hypothetical protein
MYVLYFILGVLILFGMGYSLIQGNLDWLQFSLGALVAYILGLIKIFSNLFKEDKNLKDQKFKDIK